MKNHTGEISIPSKNIEWKRKERVKYYFVLFGNRLLHTHKPSFGNYDFEIYTPSFE